MTKMTLSMATAAATNTPAIQVNKLFVDPDTARDSTMQHEARAGSLRQPYRPSLTPSRPHHSSTGRISMRPMRRSASQTSTE
jgi:hypothetical protein